MKTKEFRMLDYKSELQTWRRRTGLCVLRSEEIMEVFTQEKAMATHSSALAWRIPGTGEPGGLPSVGLHRVVRNWSDLAAAAAKAIIKDSSHAHLSVPGIFVGLSCAGFLGVYWQNKQGIALALQNLESVYWRRQIANEHTEYWKSK